MAMNPPDPSGARPPPPPVLPGFEHVRRGWHKTYAAYAARILPGEYYVTRNDEGIYTTLGSCISACIRDPLRGIGGMNHFMLPTTGKRVADGWSASGLGAAARYGNYAMEHLINEILRSGGSRENLEVKVFGGGRIIARMTDVGQRNIDFVYDYIRTEGLRLIAEDVGDIHPRMVVYFPLSGRARVKRLRSLHANVIIEQEIEYGRSIDGKPIGGAVELF
jgi:chemotaxis protein CheD